MRQASWTTSNHPSRRCRLHLTCYLSFSFCLIANITWDYYQLPQIFIGDFFLHFLCLHESETSAMSERWSDMDYRFGNSGDSSLIIHVIHPLAERRFHHAGIKLKKRRVSKEEIISFPSGLIYASTIRRRWMCEESNDEVESPQTVRVTTRITRNSQRHCQSCCQRNGKLWINLVGMKACVCVCMWQDYIFICLC